VHARTARTRLLVACWSLVLLASSPGAAIAKNCGDDVDGSRIPCACGDIVVSDTRLISTDPVVNGRCPIDGLVVRAPAPAESITLDLDGLSIVGSGAGAGIRVARGGSDGAAVIGERADRRGQVVGFRTGVHARSARSLRLLQGLELRGNRNDGLDLSSAGTIVRNVVAERNGRDGITFVGRGGRLVDVIATHNRGMGIRLHARDVVVHATVTSNGSHGLLVSGARNDVDRVRADANGGEDIAFAGAVQRRGGNTTAAGTRGRQPAQCMAGGTTR